jgi:hypothetical protein
MTREITLSQGKALTGISVSDHPGMRSWALSRMEGIDG